MPTYRSVRFLRPHYAQLAMLAGISLYACDGKPGSSGVSGGGAQGSVARMPPLPWVGAFRNEQEVGDLFIAVRFVVTETRAEYSVRSTRLGELFATQLCNVTVDGGAKAPTVPAMSCEVSINGNRAQRTIALDFSFDGTNWVRRDNGQSTVLKRVVDGVTPPTATGSTTAGATANTDGALSVAAAIGSAATRTAPSTGRITLPAAKTTAGSVVGRWERAECAKKATGGFTNLPEYMTLLKPDNGQASAWLDAYKRCVEGSAPAGTAPATTAVASTAPAPGAPSISPAPSRSVSASRGPVPLRIRASCAIEADEEGATDIFLAYGPMDESNGLRLLELWRQSASSLALMGYTRCLNVNWNFR